MGPMAICSLIIESRASHSHQRSMSRRWCSWASIGGQVQLLDKSKICGKTNGPKVEGGNLLMVDWTPAPLPTDRTEV